MFEVIIENTTDFDRNISLFSLSWVEEELSGFKFKDPRLGKRFQELVKQLSSHVGESIPLVCQDWANTKAA